MQEIAKIIKTEREKRGLTKYKLALMSGVTQSHIQQIESGLDCRVSTLKKVLEGLNLMFSIHGMPQPIKK